jgi:NAD(P)-dependent dehydrogenase (short-subunit alcohol dehydrogenase family)
MKTAIVTGGSKGIGAAIVRCFVESGYNVLVGARTPVKFDADIADAITFVAGDGANECAHIDLVNKAMELHGAVDCYVNNIGVSAWKPIGEIDDQFLDQMLSVNLKSAFWGCKAASARLTEGGSIVNVSSIAAKRGSANNSAYCAAKFGMDGLTQSLAKELGPRDIRVNAICPVMIETPGLIEALKTVNSPAQGVDPAEFVENFKRGNAALPRLPTGREVGDLCTYLASSAASALTAQCINIDCGVFPQ